MTREEAIVQIESLKNYCEYMADGDESGAYVYDLDEQALDLALSALRPVSREQVEKVWRGEWIKLSAYRGMEQYKCSKCGQEIYVPEFMGEPIYSFCPMCSSAMMDSSVDLMIDKLGEMKFE